MTNSDSLLQILLQRSNVAHFLRCDGRGQILVCSDSLLPTLGLDREQLVGRSLFDLLETSSARSLQQLLDQAPQFPVEHKLCWLGGSPMSYLLAADSSGFALLAKIRISCTNAKAASVRRAPIGSNRNF